MKLNIIKKIVAVSMVWATVLVYGLSGDGAVANNVATSTTYDYQWWTLYTVRNKLTTKYKSTTTSNSSYSTVDTFKNKKKYSVQHSFEDSQTRTSSVSCGAKVPVKAIEIEAGGMVRYSRTKTYSTSIRVPANSTVTLKVRNKIEKKKYSTVIQNQYLAINGKWYNNGSSVTRSSTQTVTSPSWLVK